MHSNQARSSLRARPAVVIRDSSKAMVVVIVTGTWEAPSSQSAFECDPRRLEAHALGAA